jgi:hypothetical protein
MEMNAKLNDTEVVHIFSMRLDNFQGVLWFQSGKIEFFTNIRFRRMHMGVRAFFFTFICSVYKPVSIFITKTRLMNCL